MTKVLMPGLRTDWRNPRNSPGLLLCTNVRPVENVLHYPGQFSDPIGNWITLDWPFPIVMDGPTGRYVGTRNKIFSLSDTYVLTEIADHLTMGPTFEPGYHWEYMDFQDYKVFNNGSTVFLMDPTTGLISIPTAAEFPRAKTMINFKGQIVMGNVAEGDNWWKWSQIGQATFTPDERNEAGYGPIPVAGPIHRLMYLHAGTDMSGRDRGHIVIYSEGGIVITKPFSEPTTTWSLHQSNDAYGVNDWGAVGGHEDEHIFIDNRGFLRRLTVKGDEVIGYKEFMQPLLANRPRITFDHIEEQYFIGDENTCYLFNKSGLGRIEQVVSSGWVGPDGLFKVTSENPSTLTLDICTDEMDLGLRARKMITLLSFAVDTDGIVAASVLTRYSPSQAYIQTPWKPLNPMGNCAPNVAGADFKIQLKVVDFTNFQLDEAFVRWKLVDKRGIRGMYGNAQTTS